MNQVGRGARLRAALRAPRTLAALLGLLTVLALLLGERDIGYVRDEGIYFEASRHYAAWVVRWANEGGEANTAKIRDRYFVTNHEHPALMKLAAGLSARLLAKPPDQAVIDEIAAIPDERKRAWRAEVAAVEGGKFPLMREGAAMRLPAILLAGLGVALLFLTGRRLGGGTLAGLLAAGWFVLLPRVAFHASLHTFDVPIAVVTLMIALAWLRALSNWRWGLAMGPLLGVAIAVKHNALFLGPLLAMHLWVCLALRWRQTGERPRWAQVAALPLVSMAVFAPLVAWALWPWLWDDTFARLAEYFAFHREHSYYNMEFRGVNYNRPPLPITYPFVMTWATVPSGLLLLSAVGLLLALRTVRNPQALLHLGRFGDVNTPLPETDNVADPPRWHQPLPSFDGREEPLLLVGLAAFPLLLIALPSVPIFGGTKHWLTAYPFLALFAAMAWGRLWWRSRTLLREWPKLMRQAPPIVLAAVLAPGAWATIHGHPYNLSQYAPLAGGTRGAAVAGFNRGFWGHAVAPLLTEESLAGGAVYLHDVHRLAAEQYRREGRWPNWTPSAISRADTALLFPEKHMLSDEIEIWESFGTTRPAMVITLDDVPITVVYQRP
jgi:4-amino-4-deoxy-L-arabinose transferase-like glycosyltransferase